MVRIVRDLEALGFKGRKGKNFRTTAILNVLRNPIYVKADSTLYYYFQSLGVTIPAGVFIVIWRDNENHLHYDQFSLYAYSA